MFGNQGAVIGLSVKVKKYEAIILKLLNNQELDEKELELVEKIKESAMK